MKKVLVILCVVLPFGLSGCLCPGSPKPSIVPPSVTTDGRTVNAPVAEDGDVSLISITTETMIVWRAREGTRLDIDIEEDPMNPERDFADPSCDGNVCRVDVPRRSESGRNGVWKYSTKFNGVLMKDPYIIER